MYENSEREGITVKYQIDKKIIKASNAKSDSEDNSIVEVITNQEDCSLFMLFSDRVERLAEDTKVLRELALQILEIYQTQINSRQNKVMQFLTVVTTIFTPLTLITGWYGMNFVNMPELQNQYGYFAIIGISLVIILFCLWYFKKKKWF